MEKTTERIVAEVIENLPPLSSVINTSPEPTLCENKQSDQQKKVDSWSSEENSRFEANTLAALMMRDDIAFRAMWIRLDEDHSPKTKALAKWVERWIKAAATNERPIKTRWMLLSGPPGTGKSHALKSANRYFRKHAGQLWPKFYKQGPPSTKWVNWSQAVSLERYGWDEFLDDVRSSNIIFVDDIGSEVDKYKTGEGAERLRIFLDKASNSWLLASTNIASQSFSDVFDARTQSRIEIAACLDLSGVQDYRSKLKSVNV